MRPYEYEEWRELLCRYGKHHINAGKQWIVGDMLVDARAKWASEWKRTGSFLDAAAGATGQSKNSLKQYMRVASAFPKECMRIHSLPWAYYQIAASIKDLEKRDGALKQASEDVLSVDEFRDLVRSILQKESPATVTMVLPKTLYRSLRKKARQREMKVRQYLQSVA